MFLNHFKFTSQPFAERVSADTLWQDDRMRQGLARLRYVAEHATVGLVTGASGVGKSALLKRFLHELSGPPWEPVYLHLTHLPAAGLFKLLVSKLDEVPRRGKDRLFEQILQKARQAEGALTDIRLLVSSALDDTPPLKIVLVGQEPLRHTLRRSLHADLLNRISVRFHLPPLTKEQTATYIDFQLKQAGGSEKLFEEGAKNLIHDYSGGIPRQINNLATACLLQAATQDASRVNEAILQQTLSEFQLP
jgi:general secretion pathway protein A